MAKKKNQESDLDQVELQGFTLTSQTSSAVSFTLTNKVSEEKSNQIMLSDLPEQMGKNQSLLTDKMILQELENEMSFDSQEQIAKNLPVITTKVAISWGNLDQIASLADKNLTVFDREVMDAVATLFQHTDTMSATTIYRAITGKNNQHVTPEQVQKVVASMEKCRLCVIEIKNEGLIKGAKGSLAFKGSLISSEQLSATTSRGEVVCFKVFSTPPLFQFAESINKVSYFPLELLDTPISKTENTITLQRQLLCNVDRIVKDLSIENKISWKEIYAILGQEDAPRQYKAKTRDTVKKILDHWVACEFFTSYEADNRSKGGLTIIV